MLAAVEVGQLLEVVWVSLLAGIGVTAMFSLVVYSGARAGEARRAKRGGEAALFAGLGVISFLVFVAGVVIGVAIMLHK